MLKLLPLLVYFCIIAGSGAAQAQQIQTTTLVEGLQSPWAMAFLPNGDTLITERRGTIKVVREGKLLAGSVEGVPPVYEAGQGGLLDILLDRQFATNNRVYLSYAHGDRENNATRLTSAKLIAENNHYALTELKTVFTAIPTKNTPHHYGGRIAQLNDATLLLTVGDGFNYREQAQTLDNHFGKIIRVNVDGSVPTDNPFVSEQDALPEIYSYGHRNQQALTVIDDVIYEHEHGPQGGDEVNIIAAGENYGWPIATYGIDYNGARISPFTSYPGMQAPKVDWTPSIAPSSMTWHQGELYVTALAEASIHKLSIEGDKINDHGVVFPSLNQRFRDIASSPDGNLYVLTDGDNARLIKITTR